jgi:seryl-tRNA synthetase
VTTISVQLPAPVPGDVRDTLRKHMYWVTPGIRAVTVVEGEPPAMVVDYEGALDGPAVARALREAASEVLAGSDAFRPVVVHDSPVVLAAAPRTDPFPTLEQRRWVCAEAPGSFTYTGPMARLIDGLDRAFRRRLSAFGPAEVQLPTLVAPWTLHTAGGLGATAPSANYVFHLQEGRSVVDRFTAACVDPDTGELDLRSVPDTSDRPDAVLSPAVCQPFYRTLSDRTLDGPQVVSGRARCYRYESGATEGLRRLREFSVRELVCVGSETAVLRARETMLEAAAELLRERRVRGQIRTAADPFFIDSFSRMRMYQLSFSVKHELLAELPFDGSDLAVGSVNYHGDHFGRAWRIRTDNGEWAHSCCMGLGLDRWAYALFAQHGPDPDQWPAAVHGLLGGADGS